MSDYGNAALVLLVMFGIWFGGNTYLRIGDLMKQFELTLEELVRDEYTVTQLVEDEVVTTVLTNPTSRIHYRRATDHEEVSISLFFKDKEKSGANNTRVVRPTGERRKYARIAYERENRLMGRLLYYQQGVSRLTRIHDNFDLMVTSIMHHHAKQVSAAPSQ